MGCNKARNKIIVSQTLFKQLGKVILGHFTKTIVILNKRPSSFSNLWILFTFLLNETHV